MMLFVSLSAAIGMVAMTLALALPAAANRDILAGRAALRSAPSVSVPVTRRRLSRASSIAPELIHARTGGQPIGWDSGVEVYTTSATIGGKAYEMIMTFGTPNVIMSKASGYSTGQRTGKIVTETFGSINGSYKVEVVLDTVSLSGITAKGVAVGKADSDALISSAARSKSVGLLGLAPENRDAYFNYNSSFQPLVVASGPTPFALTLGDKTGTLQFGQFNPSFWVPLSKLGDTWDLLGSINGVPFSQGTLDCQEDRLAPDDASADKILRGLGLKPEYIKISGGTIKTAKVDCQKGAPLTLRGPDGKGSIVVDGPSSVYRHAGQCYSIIQGYLGEKGLWIIGAQFFHKGAVFDIRGKRVGFGLSA